MSDQLSTLLQQAKHARISPESLELMGKEAANAYMSRGIALNESISKLAGTHEDINQEQIKRVCEFANQAVYLAKHDQNKTAGARVSYPEFELADPNRVIQDLSDGAKPTVVTKVDADYGRLPQRKEKLSGARGDALLAELFKTKEASSALDYTSDTVMTEVLATKDSLAALRDHLQNAAGEFEALMKESAAQFYGLAKQHILEGGSFADISNAVHSTGASDQEVSNFLQPVVVRLVKEKVSSIDTLMQQACELDKVAHRTVNPEHPMVQSAGAAIESSRELEVATIGLKDAAEQFEKVSAFLKEHIRAR